MSHRQISQEKYGIYVTFFVFKALLRNYKKFWGFANVLSEKVGKEENCYRRNTAITIPNFTHCAISAGSFGSTVIISP